MTDLLKLLMSCDVCDHYAGHRLPTVIQVWYTETGQRPHLGRYMAGVHARHQAGLPIGADQ